MDPVATGNKMFLHTQDTMAAGKPFPEMGIQTADLKTRREGIELFCTLGTFASNIIFPDNCVDIFCFHVPLPQPFLLLAFSFFLCYHGITLSPRAAGRMIGVLCRPAGEKDTKLLTDNKG